MTNENKAIDHLCKTCVRIRQGYCDGAEPEDRECQFYKRMTNADRIRAMTDEELAFYIFNHPQWVDLDGYLDWLRQEVEG